jgi:hypothetical protein
MIEFRISSLAVCELMKIKPGVNVFMNLQRIFWPKRGWPRLVVFFVLSFFLLVLLFVWTSISAHSRFQTLLELAKKEGLPSTLEEFLGPDIPDDENAAISLDQAARTIETLRDKLKQTLASKPGEETNVQLLYSKIVEQLRKTREYDDLITKASNQTKYRSLVTIARPYVLNTKLDSVQRQREIARVESSYAESLLQEGKRDDAVRRLLRGHRLTRKWERHEPFMISSLIGVAVRGVYSARLNLVLRSGPIAQQLHEEIEKEFALTDDMASHMKLASYWEILSLVDIANSHGAYGNSWIAQPIIDNDKAFFIQHIRRWGDTFDRPYFEVRDELNHLDSDFRAMAGHPVQRLLHLNSASYMPAFINFRNAHERSHARSRCLRVINQLVKVGDWRRPISELDLPENARTDPFSGKHLIIRHDEKGTTVYSVGDDLRDDHGSIRSEDRALTGGYDVGWGPNRELQNPSKQVPNQ